MNSMNFLIYRGYAASLQVDPKSQVIRGQVIDIRDSIVFKGETVKEAEKAFHDSVDAYLEFCEELGKEPSKPFSGKFLYRTTPAKHRLLAIAATKEGKSINAWLEKAVDQALDESLPKEYQLVSTG